MVQVPMPGSPSTAPRASGLPLVRCRTPIWWWSWRAPELQAPVPKAPRGVSPAPEVEPLPSQWCPTLLGAAVPETGRGDLAGWAAGNDPSFGQRQPTGGWRSVWGVGAGAGGDLGGVKAAAGPFIHPLRLAPLIMNPLPMLTRKPDRIAATMMTPTPCQVNL